MNTDIILRNFPGINVNSSRISGGISHEQFPPVDGPRSFDSSKFLVCINFLHQKYTKLSTKIIVIGFNCKNDTNY